jgi:hypothetical protein
VPHLVEVQGGDNLGAGARTPKMTYLSDANEIVDDELTKVQCVPLQPLY